MRNIRWMAVLAALALAACRETPGTSDGGEDGAADGTVADAGSDAGTDAGDAGADAADGGATDAADAGDGGATDGGGACSPACSGATPICDTATSTCKECTTSAHCTGTNPICNATAGACAGDACAKAAVLTFVNNVAAATSDTADVSADAQGSCGGADANDLVFTFTTSEAHKISAVVTPTGENPAYDPLIYLRRTCADAAEANEVACVDVGSGGDAETFSRANAPAGTYHLFIDGYEDSAGPFQLEVTLAPPVVGDDCGDPTPLTFSGNTATVSGDTAGTSDDGAGSCGGTGEPDRVYTFTTTEEKKVTIAATATGTTPTLEPVVYLRESCDADQVACMAGGPLVENHLLAGTYFVWVDGDNSSAGPFDLTVTLEAPPAAPANDACTGTPAPLAFSGTPLTATASGDTSLGANDEEGTCGGFTAADVVYTFTTSAAHKATISVEPGAVSYDALIYLRSACDVGQVSPAACLDGEVGGGTETLIVNNLAQGTYFLWVDGSGGSDGAFGLTVTLEDPIIPPLGDDCTHASPLSFGEGEAALSADSSTFANDAGGTCGGVSSADIVYSFTTSEEQRLVVSVSPTGSPAQLSPVVYLRAACADDTAENQLACALGDVGATAAFAVNNLPQGSYHLWVDGLEGTQGTFDLLVKLVSPLVPAGGETCTTPPDELEFTDGVAVAVGDTTGKADDSDGSCAGAGAPDVAFSFTTTETQHATITLAPESDVDAVVYLDSACGTTQVSGACEDYYYAGGAETLFVPSLPGGTYTVWADGYEAADAGKFELTVRLDTPAANETCANAVALTSGAAPVSGTTRFAANDYSTATCTDDSTSGPDVVYRFVAPSSIGYSVIVVPASSFDPSVYVLTDCAAVATSCVEGQDNVGRGLQEKVDFVATQGTTYYFVVDGWGSEEQGTFTIRVEPD